MPLSDRLRQLFRGKEPPAPEQQPGLYSPPERGAEDPNPSDFNVGDTVVAAGTDQSGAVAVGDERRRPLPQQVVVADGTTGEVRGVDQDNIFVRFETSVPLHQFILIRSSDPEAVTPTAGDRVKAVGNARSLDQPGVYVPNGQTGQVTGVDPGGASMVISTMFQFAKADWWNRQGGHERKWGALPKLPATMMAEAAELIDQAVAYLAEEAADAIIVQEQTREKRTNVWVDTLGDAIESVDQHVGDSEHEWDLPPTTHGAPKRTLSVEPWGLDYLVRVNGKPLDNKEHSRKEAIEKITSVLKFEQRSVERRYRMWNSDAMRDVRNRKRERYADAAAHADYTQDMVSVDSKPYWSAVIPLNISDWAYAGDVDKTQLPDSITVAVAPHPYRGRSTNRNGEWDYSDTDKSGHISIWTPAYVDTLVPTSLPIERIRRSMMTTLEHEGTHMVQWLLKWGKGLGEDRAESEDYLPGGLAGPAEYSRATNRLPHHLQPIEQYPNLVNELAAFEEQYGEQAESSDTQLRSQLMNQFVQDRERFLGLRSVNPSLYNKYMKELARAVEDRYGQADDTAQSKVAGIRRVRRAPRSRGRPRNEKRRRLVRYLYYLKKGTQVAVDSGHAGVNGDDFEAIYLKPKSRVLEVPESMLVRQASLSDEEAANALLSAVREQAEAIKNLTVMVNQLMSINKAPGHGYDAIRTEDRLIVLNPEAIEREEQPKRNRWLRSAATRSKQEGVELPDVFSEIKRKYVSSDDDVEYYLHMSAMPKVSISPRQALGYTVEQTGKAESAYKTPLGLYTYPLTEATFTDLAWGHLPFKGDANYIHIIKPTDKASTAQFGGKGQEADVPNTEDLTDAQVEALVEGYGSKQSRETSRKIFNQWNRADDAVFQMQDTMASNGAPRSAIQAVDDMADELRTTRDQLMDDDPQYDDKSTERFQADLHLQLTSFLDDFDDEILKDKAVAKKLLVVVKHMATAFDIRAKSLDIGDARGMIDEWAEESKDQSPIGRLWNVTRMAAGEGNIVRWAKLLRDVVGHNVYSDRGSGLIHSAEPEQTMFISPDSFSVVESYPNPLRKYEKMEPDTGEFKVRTRKMPWYKHSIDSLVSKAGEDVVKELVTRVANEVGPSHPAWQKLESFTRHYGARDPEFARMLAKSSRDELRELIASSPFTPEPLLLEMAETETKLDIIRELLAYGGTSVKQRLAKNDHEPIRKQALSFADEATLLILAEDESTAIRKRVAGKTFSQDLLAQMADDPEAGVRAVVARRVRSNGVLERLAEDPNTHVAEAARARLNTEPEAQRKRRELTELSLQLQQLDPNHNHTNYMRFLDDLEEEDTLQLESQRSFLEDRYHYLQSEKAIQEYTEPEEMPKPPAQDQPTSTPVKTPLTAGFIEIPVGSADMYKYAGPERLQKLKEKHPEFPIDALAEMDPTAEAQLYNYLPWLVKMYKAEDTQIHNATQSYGRHSQGLVKKMLTGFDALKKYVGTDKYAPQLKGFSKDINSIKGVNELMDHVNQVQHYAKGAIKIDEMRSTYDKKFNRAIKEFARRDPTGDQTYLPWAMYALDYLDTHRGIEDPAATIDQIATVYNKWHTLAMNNPDTLRASRLAPGVGLSQATHELDQAEEYIDAGEGDFKVLHEDDDWRVIELLDKVASCKLGKDRWCVSSWANSYWESYMDKPGNRLIMFQAKKGEPDEDDMLVHVGPSGKIQEFKDSTNEDPTEEHIEAITPAARAIGILGDDEELSDESDVEIFVGIIDGSDEPSYASESAQDVSYYLNGDTYARGHGWTIYEATVSRDQWESFMEDHNDVSSLDYALGGEYDSAEPETEEIYGVFPYDDGDVPGHSDEPYAVFEMPSDAHKWVKENPEDWVEGGYQIREFSISVYTHENESEKYWWGEHVETAEETEDEHEPLAPGTTIDPYELNDGSWNVVSVDGDGYVDVQNYATEDEAALHVTPDPYADDDPDEGWTPHVGDLLTDGHGDTFRVLSIGFTDIKMVHTENPKDVREVPKAKIYTAVEYGKLKVTRTDASGQVALPGMESQAPRKTNQGVAVGDFVVDPDTGMVTVFGQPGAKLPADAPPQYPVMHTDPRFPDNAFEPRPLLEPGVDPAEGADLLESAKQLRQEQGRPNAPIWERSPDGKFVIVGGRARR